ncbi:pilin [Pelomonas sp. CA6]|nr:pilin [Pelomonas sp. CA6]
MIAATTQPKTNIQEWYTVKGTMPTTADIPMPAIPNNGVLGGIAFDGTKITVTGSSKVSQLSGKTLEIVANSNNESISWKCQAGSSNPIDLKYLPASCKGS